MKYNVHLFAVVRVLVPDLEAESVEEAITKALEREDLAARFGHPALRPGLSPGDVDYADDIAEYRVDPLLPDGEVDYPNSEAIIDFRHVVHMTRDGEPHRHYEDGKVFALGAH